MDTIHRKTKEQQYEELNKSSWLYPHREPCRDRNNRSPDRSVASRGSEVNLPNHLITQSKKPAAIAGFFCVTPWQKQFLDADSFVFVGLDQEQRRGRFFEVLFEHFGDHRQAQRARFADVRQPRRLLLLLRHFRE